MSRPPSNLVLQKRAELIELQDLQRKREIVKKLLAIADLIQRDTCKATYHNMRIDGPRISWHPDIEWTKELLWGGKKTITLTICVEPVEGKQS